jgi:hypothetical protein
VVAGRGLLAVIVLRSRIPYSANWMRMQLATTLVLLTLARRPSLASGQSSPLEEELWQAQKRNQEAQAAYYQKQLQEKPFVQQLTDNLAAVAAFTTAFVAVISFLFNYCSTLRNQMDAQFYGAPKRFGDKDSPTLRTSAAGLLSQMGQLRRIALRSRAPYYYTAFNQLTTDYLLENDPVASGAFSQAIDVLARSHDRWASGQIFP